MKKSILYLLLFSYTSMLCKPILPYIADGIEHVLLYDQHVATVHIENGKMHVHKEAVEAGADQSDDQPSTTIKKNRNGSEHLSPTHVENYHRQFRKIVLNQHVFISHYHTVPFPDYPPPRWYFI